jgi:hypothetical protein
MRRRRKCHGDSGRVDTGSLHKIVGKAKARDNGTKVLGLADKLQTGQGLRNARVGRKYCKWETCEGLRRGRAGRMGSCGFGDSIENLISVWGSDAGFFAREEALNVGQVLIKDEAGDEGGAEGDDVWRSEAGLVEDVNEDR